MNKSRKEALKAYKNEDFNTALELLLTEDIDPAEDPDLSYYLALCYSRIGEMGMSEKYLQLVLQSEEDFSRLLQARLLMAFINNTLGQFSTAEYYLNKLIEEGYKAPQIYTGLGYATWSQGLYEESIDNYEKALEIEPENITAINSLGYLLAERDINHERSVTLCQKAVAADPLNGNYLDSLGWAYYKSGNIAEARLYLEKAYEQKKSDVIRNHLEIVNGQKKNS